MGFRTLLPKRVRVVTAVVQQDVSNISRAFRSRRTRTYRTYTAHRWTGSTAAARPVVEVEIRIPAHELRPPAHVESVLVFGDTGVSVDIQDPEMTILEAGLAAGIELPYSCTLGGCGACAIDVESGDVEYEDPESVCLSEAEQKKGRCLACVGRPRGRVVVKGWKP